MNLRKLFPCAVAACFVLNLSVFAQSSETRVRQTRQQVATATEADEEGLRTEPVVVSVATPEEIRVAKIPSARSVSPFNLDNLISNAIEERLGARYRWGATGPFAFDCSGFVWATFQDAGINFERASARSLWSRFQAPEENDELKFGTLVFFSNLTHVGIVADEHGFYHASRRHGVIYSPFSDYWKGRIDGFRRVPVPITARAE